MSFVQQALVVCSCAAVLFSGPVRKMSAAEQPSRPNVILILLDDLGWADLGCYGSTYHKSPHIDRLAAEGMRFTQAYAAAPVCSPTRAALLTGRWPARLHVTDWLPGSFDQPTHRLAKPKTETVLPLAEVTLAEVLQANGYVTGHIGKWHLGGRGFGPRKQGFDVNIGGDEKGTPKGYFAPFCEKNGCDVPHLDWAPPGTYLTDIFNNAAIRFIRENREKPFFLYLPHFAVHTPLHAKFELVSKYKIKEKRAGQQQNPVYAAMIESVDDGVGRIVKELEKLQLAENTIILFTSDNGGVATADWPLTPPTVNGPLREGKGHLYEGGIRVPLIVRWPQKIRAGAVCETPVCSVDFLPTILDLCGVDPAGQVKRSSNTGAEKRAEEPREWDGVSFSPLLREQGELVRDALYWHYPHYSPQHGRPSGAIRVGDYKLLVFYENYRRELYNLKTDPGETTNLVDQQPDLVRELGGKLSTWRHRIGAQMMHPNPLYAPNPQHADGIVSLHVRAADIHGTQLRYESPPHRDSLRNWVRKEDWASFEFELAQPRKFDVELVYSCGPDDAGSEVELTIGSHVFPMIVQETGAEPKFAPRVIGTVELLRVGRHYLTIKPKTKPGQLVMDLRRVRLLPLK